MSTREPQRRVNAQTTRLRRLVAWSCGLTFLACACATFLQSAYWNAQVGRDAAKRATTRLLADGSLYSVSSNDAGRGELDSRLNAAAREYLKAQEFSDAASRVVARGLTQWREDSGTFGFKRNADRLASQNAVDALTAIGSTSTGSDDELDAALAFLQELDGASDASSAAPFAKALTDTLIWAFEFERNPTDALGVVSRDELEAVPFIQTARRACDASARLLAFATFFVFLGASRVVPVGAELPEVLRALRRVFSGFVDDRTFDARERRDANACFFPIVFSLSTVRLRN